jgi:hypothetical protein
MNPICSRARAGSRSCTYTCFHCTCFHCACFHCACFHCACFHCASCTSGVRASISSPTRTGPLRTSPPRSLACTRSSPPSLSQDSLCHLPKCVLTGFVVSSPQVCSHRPHCAISPSVFTQASLCHLPKCVLTGLIVASPQVCSHRPHCVISPSVFTQASLCHLPNMNWPWGSTPSGCCGNGLVGTPPNYVQRSHRCSRATLCGLSSACSTSADRAAHSRSCEVPLPARPLALTGGR